MIAEKLDHPPFLSYLATETENTACDYSYEYERNENSGVNLSFEGEDLLLQSDVDGTLTKWRSLRTRTDREAFISQLKGRKAELEAVRL